MRVVRWRRRSVITLLIFLILVGLLTYGGYRMHIAYVRMQCSDALSRQMLDALCKLYQGNKVAGNLCPDICTTHSIMFKKCLNYRDGKKILTATWKQMTVILKSKNAYLGDYYPIWYQDGETIKYPPVKSFASTIRQTVEERIGTSLPGNLDMQNLANQYWSMDYNDFMSVSPEKQVPAFLDSVYSLLQQDEYVMMKHFQNSNYFPDIYGTCGHFYAMEYVPPGGVLDPAILSFNDKSTWNQRRSIALKILDLVHHFEQNFHQVLHLCDVKNENFGVTLDGRLKAIDVDMAYFHDSLRNIMKQENCSKHADCDYFDCRGWCDLKTSMCTDRRINNNLQVVCEDVFMHRLGNAFKGLLRNPPEPVQARLNKVLKECADPLNNQEKDIRLKASDETYQELYNLLLESNTDLYPTWRWSHHDH